MLFNMKKSYFIVLSLLELSIVIVCSGQEMMNLVNLDQHCFRCLCHAATKCNLTIGCVQGYCGPFKISKVYWKDAGEVILPDDEKERAGAYEDCALSFNCAKRIVTNYFIKYGRDCNGDGVTDCYDYSMINFNGGYQCSPSLERNDPGKAWLDRYRTCNPQGRADSRF